MTSNSRNSQSEDDIDCDDGEDKVSMYKQVAERTPNFKSQTNRNRTFFLRFKYPIFIASFVALSALISGLLFWRCGKERALFAPISMPISLMYEGFRVSLFVAVCLFMHLCVYILFKLGTFLFMGKLRDSFAKSVSREFKLQLVVRLELQLCNLVSSILAMAASEFMFRIPTPATIAPDPSKQPQKIELGLSLFLDLYKYWSEFWGVYSQYPTFVKAAVHAIAVFFVLMTIEMVLMSIVSSRFHQVHFYGKIEKNDLAINLFENLKRQMRRSKKIKISLSSATITVQNNLAHLSAESPAGSPRNAAIPTQDSDKMLQSEIDREMGIAGVIFDFLQSLTTNEFLRVDDFGGFLSAQDAHTFFALVSADDNDTLTRTEFVGSIGRIYQAKQNIISSLSNHTIILDELDIIFKMIFVLLWILMTSQVLFLVVAAFAIIFSFLYESTLKALIKSIVFVIVTHPYDIGDSIIIQGSKYRVKEIHMLTTVFVGISEEIVYMNNVQLARTAIGNLNRSHNQRESIVLQIFPSTPKEVLEELKQRLTQFLAANPREYESTLQFHGLDIINEERMTLKIQYKHRSNFQDSDLFKDRRMKFVKNLRQNLLDLGIRLSPPQTVAPAPTRSFY